MKDEKLPVMFTLPGADAELMIRQESTTHGVQVKLDKLGFWTQVDFFRADPGNVLLNATTERGYQPYVVCPVPDLGDRTDGRGSFTRIYQQGSTVTLQAPLTHGACASLGGKAICARRSPPRPSSRWTSPRPLPYARFSSPRRPWTTPSSTASLKTDASTLAVSATVKATWSDSTARTTTSLQGNLV